MNHMIFGRISEDDTAVALLESKRTMQGDARQYNVEWYDDETEHLFDNVDQVMSMVEHLTAMTTALQEATEPVGNKALTKMWLKLVEAASHGAYNSIGNTNVIAFNTVSKQLKKICKQCEIKNLKKD